MTYVVATPCLQFVISTSHISSHIISTAFKIVVQFHQNDFQRYFLCLYYDFAHLLSFRLARLWIRFSHIGLHAIRKNQFKSLASFRLVDCWKSSSLIASTKYWAAKLARTSGNGESEWTKHKLLGIHKPFSVWGWTQKSFAGFLNFQNYKIMNLIQNLCMYGNESHLSF